MSDAKELISRLAVGVVGGVTSSLLSDELRSALSTGSAATVEGYMARIEAQLGLIHERLDDLQVTASKIKDAVSILSSQVTDAVVQPKLDSFNKNASRLQQYFNLYLDALQGLSSQDPAQRAQAERMLFTLLGPDKASEIGEDLSAIGDAFLPSMRGIKGIIELQKEVLTAALKEVARDPQRFFSASTFPTYVANDSGQQGYYSGQGMLLQLQETARSTLDSVVLDAFRSFSTASLQGLILLSAAWEGTPFASEVESKASQVREVVDAMLEFQAGAAQMVNGLNSEILHDQGKRLRTPTKWVYIDGTDMPMDYSWPDNWIQWYPFDAGGGRLLLVIVENPWLFGTNKAVVGASGDQYWLYSNVRPHNRPDVLVWNWQQPQLAPLRMPTPFETAAAAEFTRLMAGIKPS